MKGGMTVVVICVCVVVLALLGASLYFRVAGDIEVCRNYYKELSLPACYFSSKTVRIPEGR